MKKTVIKRRKRVPAAGPAMQMSSPNQGGTRQLQNRMSEQAAAEALVSVGRGTQERSAGEESDDDYRARKKTRRVGSEMETDYEETDRRKRDSWQDDQQGVFPSFSVDNPQGSRPYYGQNTGGYDLPPLNAAIGGGETSSRRISYASAGLSTSSYARSEGTVPSRTHSPATALQSSAGMASSIPSSGGLTTGIHLPLPHGLAQGHGHPFYQSGMAPARTSSPRAPSPLREGGSSINQVPTLADLQHHYHELEQQRRKMQEMMEKTDRLMAGVKRGIDELQQASARGGNGSGNGGSASIPPSSGGASSVPLGSRSERRDSSNVWPVTSDQGGRD